VLDRLHIADGDRVMRIKPRENPEVNQWWICDEGRYGYQGIDHGRLLKALHRTDGTTEGRGWDQILSEVAEKLKTVNPEKGLCLASPQLTNEELFLIRKLFRERLGLKQVVLFSPKTEGYQDDFLIRADKNPNTQGARELGFSIVSPEDLAKRVFDTLYIFGQDLFMVMPQAAVKPILDRATLLIYQGRHVHPTEERAHFSLPAAVYAEKSGTFTNCDRRVQQIFPAFPPLGEAKPDWWILTQLAERLGFDFGYGSPEAVLSDIAASVPAFKGLSYAEIGKKGKWLA
jgi:NADH-quinone oxidoreductase subunit G